MKLLENVEMAWKNFTSAPWIVEDEEAQLSWLDLRDGLSLACNN